MTSTLQRGIFSRSLGSVSPALTLMVMFVFAIVAYPSAQAQTFNTVLSFDGTDGSAPFYMSFVQGTDGRLYGTTQQGGTYDGGTVFKMTPSGKPMTLYNFNSS